MYLNAIEIHLFHAKYTSNTFSYICEPLCEIQAKVKNLIMRKQASSLITSINFTIISIFDMTLLRQY